MASSAVAQDDDEGRRVHEAATEAYRVGQYQAAMELFREAYELSGRPQLLFNIAMSAEHIRRDEEALAAYRAFLASEHESVAERRRAIEARIVVLETAIRDETPVTDDTEEAEDAILPPTAPAPEPVSRLPGWILGGSSVAAILAGAVFSVAGLSARSGIENADSAVWDEGAYSRSQWMPPVGLTALITGAIGLTVAIILLVVE
jgi:tetratricopeptide (TPR) repeat protein